MLDSNKKQLPLITIGVSAYNRKDYLKLSLNSLLNQTYPNCEIIVIDDGSTDGTDAMMAEEYPQIKYVKQTNGGDASAKNHAAKIANGKYIVFNDSDDLFLPDSVERLYNALPPDGFGISYGTYQTIDAEGKETDHDDLHDYRRAAGRFPYYLRGQ
jgi:glycosyltransferase involved in cell wall biosynthesis